MALEFWRWLSLVGISNRPEVSEEEYLSIRQRIRSSQAICYFEVIENQKINSYSSVAPWGVNLVSVSESYDKIRSLSIPKFFSQRELYNGEPVAVLGGSIALKSYSQRSSMQLAKK